MSINDAYPSISDAFDTHWNHMKKRRSKYGKDGWLASQLSDSEPSQASPGQNRLLEQPHPAAQIAQMQQMQLQRMMQMQRMAQMQQGQQGQQQQGQWGQQGQRIGADGRPVGPDGLPLFAMGENPEPQNFQQYYAQQPADDRGIYGQYGGAGPRLYQFQEGSENDLNNAGYSTPQYQEPAQGAPEQLPGAYQQPEDGNYYG